MVKRKCKIMIKKITISYLVLLALLTGGCVNKNALLSGGPIPLSAPIRIQTTVPMISESEASEKGVFITAAKGPGLVHGGISFLQDGVNNYSNRKLLNSILNYEDYSVFFRSSLRNGLGQKVCSSDQMLAEPQSYDPAAEYYSLNICLSYGIYKNSGRPVAKLAGELIRFSDGKTLWRNKLIYECPAPRFAAPYGSDKQAAHYWNFHRQELRESIKNANSGLAELLVMELTHHNMVKPLEPIQTFKLYPDTIIHAQIIEKGSGRIIFREDNGLLRCVPADSIEAKLRPVLSFL